MWHGAGGSASSTGASTKGCPTGLLGRTSRSCCHPIACRSAARPFRARTDRAVACACAYRIRRDRPRARHRGQIRRRNASRLHRRFPVRRGGRGDAFCVVRPEASHSRPAMRRCRRMVAVGGRTRDAARRLARLAIVPMVLEARPDVTPATLERVRGRATTTAHGSCRSLTMKSAMSDSEPNTSSRNELRDEAPQES